MKLFFRILITFLLIIQHNFASLSSGREYASNLEDDIEMQLNEYSFAPPADLATINEAEIRAVLQQPFEKDLEENDEIELQQNGWCGKKFVYGTISDLCGLATLICASVGASKLAADSESSVGLSLTFSAAGLTAAQTFFKKLQDNETAQRNNHTKKVAKSTLAANNVLLQKMVTQERNFTKKLQEEEASRKLQFIELLKKQKKQIQELQSQHNNDLAEIERTSGQAEALQVSRKQEIKDQAKVLSTLVNDAKHLLKTAKYSLSEGNDKLVADIEDLIKRSDEAYSLFLSPIASILSPQIGRNTPPMSPLSPHRKITAHGVSLESITSRKQGLTHQETNVTPLMDSKPVANKSSSSPPTRSKKQKRKQPKARKEVMREIKEKAEKSDKKDQ